MTTSKPLRIITFNHLPIAYQLLTNWIKEEGHKHVLAVTTPGPRSRPTPSYKGVVGMAERDIDVLVTTRLRRVATPLIRELRPDLIACMSFPYRITPELCSIPTYGAVNVHPSVLPAYRGINAFRPFYEGADVFGATAHWIDDDYDTGKILSQKSAPMPEVIDENVLPIWLNLLTDVTRDGMRKAVAGEVGVEQDESLASLAAVFSEDESWLDWRDSQRVIKRKVFALNGMSAGSAKARVNGEVFTVFGCEVLAQSDSSATVGDCLERDDDRLVVQAGDGPVRIQIQDE